MKHQIFSTELVEEAARKMKVANLQEATIGDVLLVASYLENETGIPFIRMDQGSPGLPANRIGDDLIIYTDDTRNTEQLRMPQLRNQQADTEVNLKGKGRNECRLSNARIESVERGVWP